MAKKRSTKKSILAETILPKTKLIRFIGVSLAGGKSDKTCMAVVEYYPEHRKIFLSRLIDRVKTENEISADLKLHELLCQYGKEVELVAFDVPLTLPKCVRCDLPCPGFEVCQEPEIRWMWKHYQNFAQKKKPRKVFTPYTERCVEMYLAHNLEEKIIVSHALGANAAPLLARAHFIRRRLPYKAIEVVPKLSIWRIGQALKIPKSHLRFHRHSVGGDESRMIILKALADHNIAFVYQQDLNLMVENTQAFEAFICALTGYLNYTGQTESRPEKFPRDEAWVEFPRSTLSWR